MTTIAAGNHQQIYFDHLDDIVITPGSGGTVNFDCSTPNSAATRPTARIIYSETVISIPAGSTVFLDAVGADATYDRYTYPSRSSLESAYPASSNAGKSAMAGPIMYVGDGAAWLPVSLAVVDDVIPSDSDVVQVSLNNSGSQVVGCGGMLLTIRCTAGASVVLTVIDNPFGSTGRTVYTGTLSAGDVVAVNGYALHGLYASTPGVGSFEFDHKGGF